MITEPHRSLAGKRIRERRRDRDRPTRTPRVTGTVRNVRQRLQWRPRACCHVVSLGGRTRRCATHIDLGYLEIALRNGIHNALAEYHSHVRRRPVGAEWFDGPSWLRHRWFDNAGQAAINEACCVAGHWSPRSSRPDAVVAAEGRRMPEQRAQGPNRTRAGSAASRTRFRCDRTH